jgi:hypothetical protein
MTREARDQLLGVLDSAAEDWLDMPDVAVVEILGTEEVKASGERMRAIFERVWEEKCLTV